MAITQIILSLIIIGLILLQQRSAGISGLLGGDSGGFYQARRGMERIVFYSTIVACVLFVALALYQLIHG